MEYCIGQKVEVDKKVTREDICAFADFSGDYNPIHLDEKYAKNSKFGKCIAHGMIGGAFISAVIGTRFPGKGTIYLEQNLKFIKPIYVNENIKIVIELVELLGKNKAGLSTNIFNENKEHVVIGTAKVILPVCSGNIKNEILKL